MFEKLKNVKIFFETPEELAKHLNDIHLDIYDWWNQQELQSTKNEFCYNYARKSENWASIWVDLFETL